MRTVNAVMVLALSCLLAYACVGCPPRPQPVPVAPDGSQDASVDVGAPNSTDAALDASMGVLDAGEDLDAARYPACAKACINLGALGCPEARAVDGGQSCYAVCAHAEETHKFDLKPACLAAAKSIAEAKACGSVRCLK